MQDPLEYLYGLKSTDIRLGLGPFTRVIERLGNPHTAYPTVLIGGTNGKGSIAAMVSSILIHAGLRVGLYTSPHLIDFRERVRINGELIAPSAVYEMMEEIRQKMGEEITYFEFLTAVAFLHFFRQKVDIAVLEVGMGGRLDATNVVRPVVSVVSNVSLDHKEYLGNRLDAIAREKGGIIKKNGVCITAAKQKRVMEILEGICHRKKAKLYRIGREIKVNHHDNGTFTYRGVRNNYRRLTCALRGRHQIENAAVAVGVIELLTGSGIEIDEKSICEGLREVRWEGRLEVLQREPVILVDGAHNPAGTSALSRTLREDFSYERLILIFGVLSDKDYGSMLKRLAPLADRLLITRPDTSRGMPAVDVASAARRYRNEVEIVENGHNALKRALAIAQKNDLICVTGSLYLVGEIKRMYSECIGVY